MNVKPKFEGWSLVIFSDRPEQFIENDRLLAFLAANPGATVSHEMPDRELGKADLDQLRLISERKGITT